MNKETCKKTIVISAFPACGKSYTFNHYNGKPFTMLDSDSSKFSWIYDENGNKTDKRNPNFIADYIKHIKDNIGKVDVIFVSSHAEVRKALRDNNIKFFMVFPTYEMKDIIIERMINRGNDEKFIEFQKENYEKFIDEILGELRRLGYRNKLSDNNEYIDNPCMIFSITKNYPFIDNDFISSSMKNINMCNVSSL